MTIAYVGAGTVAFLLGNGALNVPMPAGLADDDIVFIALQGRAWINPTNPNPTISGTWAAVQSDAASGNAIIRVYWKRVTAGESDPTLTYTGGNPTQDHMLARAVAYRGVRVTGNPWDVKEVLNVVNETTTSPDISAWTNPSLETNCRAIYLMSSNRPDATGVDYLSAWTVTGLTDIQRRTDNTQDSFIGSAVYVTDGLAAAVGTVGAGTFTAPSLASRTFIVLALMLPGEPDPPAAWVPSSSGAAIVWPYAQKGWR